MSSTLGTLPDHDAVRDAVHVAIAPVVAGETLHPGQRVGWLTSQKDTVGDVPEKIGIVDPFLDNAVYPGERVYICALPGTVTKLTHHWEHPAFVDPGVERGIARLTGKSEAWLRNYASSLNMSYENLLAAASNWIADRSECDVGYHQIDIAHEHKREFWEHVSKVTNLPIPVGCADVPFVYDECSGCN